MADSPYTTSVWRSFKWGAWWHCGSIAFGSFIIALITFIRILFEYIIYQYEQVGNKENPVYKCLKCCIRYVLWCLDEDTGGSEMTPKSLQGFLTENDKKMEKERKFTKVDDNADKS